MDNKEIAAFFDDMASRWDDMQVRNERVIAEILQKGGITENTRVLDIACGTGVLFPDYISLGAEVTGIDISANMAEKAREKYPHIKVICGDAAEYSFEEAFDAVMIYNAFPHFPKPDKLIKNLSDALREKGRLTVAHGISEKELAECHSTVARDVSLPLPSKERLCDMMSDFFDVDVMISDEEKYIVSGLKNCRKKKRRSINMEHNHHNHTHNHSTDGETLALLKYMAHHNAHHAEELSETASSLSEEAATLIKEAVELLNKSTEKINQAIRKEEE